MYNIFLIPVIQTVSPCDLLTAKPYNDMRNFKIKLIGIFLLFFVSIVSMQGQINPKEIARQELERRGLNEQEVRIKLLERGIDIDNIDPTNVAQVQMVEQALKEVAAELESEKKAEALKKEAEANKNDATENEKDEESLTEEEQRKVIAKDTEDISDAVEDGATIEEAVSEELTDAQDEALPDAIVFGQQIFRNKGIKLYRKSEDVKPPADYVLGVGDKVTVSIWGYSQESIVFEIDEAGYIKPPQMPRIYLKGITLGSAKDLLSSRFGQYYRFRPQEFEVTINYSRTININIVGEVFNYGSFSIPAINTAFNALVAAGGPSDIGSVRNIKLMRAGEKPKIVDIYEYLLDPSESTNLYLEENDYIYVPVSERLIKVEGAIKRPFTYELISGENLIKLIEYAGGFKDNAIRGNIQLKRYINDKEVIEDIDYRTLKKEGRDFELLTGDEIMVRTIERKYDNFVSIEGAVELPGEYEVGPAMKLTDLLDKSVLTEGARTDIAFIRRTNADGTVRYERVEIQKAIIDPLSDDNITLRAKDKVIIYSSSNFVDVNSIRIAGSVRSPGSHPYNPDGNLRIEDAVILGGGLKEDAAEYAYVKRTNNKNNNDKTYLRINIQNAIANSDSEDNILLEPMDEIFVYSQEEFTTKTSVQVNGKIRKPGVFDFDEGLRVSDLIYFANGLEPNAEDFAYIYRTNLNNTKQGEYIRVNIREVISNPNSSENVELKPLDNLIIYGKERFYENTFINVEGAVFESGVYRYSPDLTIRDVLSLSGGITIKGDPSRIDVSRIVLEGGKPTKTIVANLSLNDDLEVDNKSFKLEPFDYINVRTLPNFGLQKFILLSGEVKYPGKYSIIKDNEPISSIIERAGGLTDESFAEGATLYRKNNDIGYVVIKLEEVMKNKKSKFNIIIKPEDKIEIPKKKDLVSIIGEINASERYNKKVSEAGKINVAYHKSRNAKFYVDKFAGGVGEKGHRKLITVRDLNGELRRTKNFGLFKIYPKVRKGSTIIVNEKDDKGEVKAENKESVDWNRVIASTIAQATSVLTLLLLFQRID